MTLLKKQRIFLNLKKQKKFLQDQISVILTFLLIFFIELNTRKKETKPHKNLQEKVGIFLEQLDSKEDKDIECNAEILAEIIKSFAVTFSLEISDIVQIIEESGGPLNMEEIRSKLMERAK